MSLHVGLAGTGHLEEMLQACGMRVTRVTALQEFLRALAAPPDVFVIDVRGSANLPASLADLKRQYDTPVVMVTTSLEPALMLEAMRAGISECVVEPVTQNDLASAIARVAGPAGRARNGSVIAVIGAKGGVGCTTLAVNLATALKQVAASDTLLIDLHLAYGDASMFLGVEPRYSTADALENIHRLDEAFFRALAAKTEGGPDLLASSNRVGGSGPAEVRNIRALVEFASRQYPYTVLDVARSTTAVLDALDAVTTFIVVANQELPTLRSAAAIAGSLGARYGLDKVQVVLNRYDSSAEIADTDVTAALGLPINHRFPSDYRAAIQALNASRPLVLEPRSKLAQAFLRLARAVAGVDNTTRSTQRSARLLNRLGLRLFEATT